MAIAPTLNDTLDPRSRAILEAAFQTFCQYGYRRTSMEDIARAAGMSRAALYLHYKNKQDIFRSLAQLYFDGAEAGTQAALQPGISPQQALSGVFAAKAGPEMEGLFSSPHGEELLDVNFSVCGDIVREGEARIASHLAHWLSAEAAAGRIAPFDPDESAEALAQTIIAAVAGQKAPQLGYPAYRAAGERLAALFGRGLMPPVR